MYMCIDTKDRQTEKSHCDLYSLIYGHFPGDTDATSEFSGLHMNLNLSNFRSVTDLKCYPDTCFNLFANI